MQELGNVKGYEGIQLQYLWSGEDTEGTFSNLVGLSYRNMVEDHLEKWNQSVGRQTWASFLRRISKRRLGYPP